MPPSYGRWLFGIVQKSVFFIAFALIDEQGCVMRVCVLGAGIVGLATAYQLSLEGHQVTVVDRSAPGGGTSGGNGAQLSYSYVQPLADPSIWRQLPKLLLAHDSPLKLRLQADPAQWAWALRFMLACNANTSQRTTQQLLRLAAASRAVFEQMMKVEQLACDFSSTGKLVIYDKPQAFAAAQKQMLLQQALGSVQHAVSAAQCVAIEPALLAYQAHFHGAIHTPSECAVDCQKLCDGLVATLRQRGVQFALNMAVTGWQQRAGHVHAVRTAQEELEADAFVLALGAQASQLARPLGVTLPIYPIKGYSITLDAQDQPGAAPTVSVTDATRKVVFARIGNRLRVAGMAELVGYGLDIPTARIASLQASTAALFPHTRGFAVEKAWAGLRPATPTGLPLVGRLPGAPANVLFNVGHGPLGLTLAFGTAQQVSKLLLK
jgi:D-amino-acid dehydrogenase